MATNHAGYGLSPQLLYAIEEFVSRAVSAVPVGGTTGQVLAKISNADGDVGWTAVVSAAGGDALVANPLSQFAATTSAQLFSVLSNKTGTGLNVFGTAPNITSPTGIVKGDVGLGNVDNVADANKPVSAAQATADTAVQNFAIARANHTGTQTASTISDFTEASQDVIGAMVVAAGGTYDDAGNAITFPAGGAAITVQDEGTPLSTAATTLNFVGAGIVASGSGAVKTITVSGAGTGDALVANPLSQFAPTTSAQLAGVLTDESGSGGGFVRATSPTLVTPILGTPTSVTLTNATGLPVSTGISGLGTGVATFLATPSSANLASALTDKTGTGVNVFGTGPTISAPVITGIASQAGANFTPASAMGALAIDVTAALNTKSIAADSTFTFSGTPANSDQWFGLYVKNTDTNPHIITFPSAFSQATQAARTTCPIPASGELWMIWRYDGAAYKVFGDSPFLNNYIATAAPAVTDDVAKGYGTGSFWYDATGNALYICETAGSGAAVWTAVASGGTGTVTHTGGALTANALVLGAGSADTKVVAGITSDGTSVVTLGVAGTSVGGIDLKNATSGTISVRPATGALGSVTWTVPAATDTAVGKATTDTLTNKTYDTAGTGNAFSINGLAATTNTGTGAVVRATSPALVTPALGVATATSINGLAINTSTGTLAVANGKTATVNNTLTLAGTDGTTMTFPGVSANIGYLGIPQNSKSANYTTVLGDAGTHIFHPSADTTARTFTIDSNANVAYPIGATLTFVNQNAGGVITIAITSDTMRLAGAGTTGSRSLAANGIATALKVAATEWLINGVGLT